MAPKLHKNPQKNLPNRMVIMIYPKNNNNCTDISSKENFPERTEM
jgi:hypothetical protein